MTQPVGDDASFGPQVIFGMDLEGRCTLSVGSGLAVLGIRPGQLVGQDLTALYTRPEDLDALRRALAGEAFSTLGWWNGRLLQTTYEPVHDAAGHLEGVAGVATDVTEHARAQEELTRFKALADGSQDLIAITDDAGTPSYQNPRLAALGLPLGGAPAWPTVAGLTSESLAAELRDVVSRGERWSGEVAIGLPQGEVGLRAEFFPLFSEDRSRRLGTGFVAQDVTELRAAHADLRQFQALVEASHDFIAIAGLDGGVRYVNPAGRAMVGLPADIDVTTTTIADYLTPDGLERALQIEQPAVVEHGHWRGESTLRRAGAEPIPVEITSFLMHDPETGEPFALATVQRDITERLAATRAHEEFVTLVAHELRTPLTSVRGYIEIAGESLESQADPVRLSGHLKVAARNIARMERLVEQILQVAGENRHRPGDDGPIDLVTVVEQAVESARPGADHAGLRLVLTAPESPLPTLLDETFTEVVDNLVSNAVKFTPRGGEIAVSLTREGNEAVLRVTDTGSGVPARDRDSIFEKFARGDIERQSVPGLGLGLFITRAIVRSHGGEVGVEDGPDGGACFVVRLPVARDEAPRDVPAP